MGDVAPRWGRCVTLGVLLNVVAFVVPGSALIRLVSRVSDRHGLSYMGCLTLVFLGW